MKIADAFHFETQEILKSIKMISAQHSSNNGKNWQKLSYPKNALNMVIFSIKVRRSYRVLSSQADPAREN